MTAARWAALAALAFALYFGVQGGEYGTTDLFALRRQEASERDQVERLRQVVDSLAARRHGHRARPAGAGAGRARAVRHDPRGELLYRLVPADSAAR